MQVMSWCLERSDDAGLRSREGRAAPFSSRLDQDTYVTFGSNQPLDSCRNYSTARIVPVILFLLGISASNKRLQSLLTQRSLWIAFFNIKSLPESRTDRSDIPTPPAKD